MIRVLLVPSSDYLGHPFPQRYNQLFERVHDGKNFEVHVVRFRIFDGSSMKTNLIVHELDDTKVKPAAPYYLLNVVNHALSIRRIIRQESIDLVVFSNLLSPFACTLMEELTNIHVPTIFDLPDYYPTSATGYIFNVKSIQGKLLTEIFDYMLRYIIRRATVVTAASHALVKYSRRAGARSVVYVPNGISEHFLKLHDGKGLREKLGFNEDDIVIGYIGSIEFWLDMKSLIQGVALARRKNPYMKLLLFGGGLHTHYSKKVDGWIRQERLEEHSVQLGFVPYEEVPKYIAGFDVGTIPFDQSNSTAYYAAPNKMWEYLSQMKPVISTPIPEALSNKDFVFMSSTPRDYAQKLQLVAKGDGEVLWKVKRGHERALSRTWRNSAIRLSSILYELTAKDD